MSNEYATRAQLKERLGITDAANDAALDEVLEGVSRAIDDYCGRRFYAATETRYYTAVEANLLTVDDLLTLTTLKTDGDGDRVYEDTWATTDYDLEPYNASLEGRPYWRIRTTPNGKLSFPKVRKGVEIVGSWGYRSTVPVQVREACLLQSARIHRRRDQPYGVYGMPASGTAVFISRIDPDVQALLAPFRLVAVG